MMTSLEEPFTMINTCSDERAAGVISGSDPYRELELYLEKVNEEIGEVFDKWGANSRLEVKNESSKWKKEQPVDENEAKNYVYGTEHRNRGEELNLFKSYSLPNRSRQSRSFENYLDAWSKSLLAEFNTIIQDEHYRRCSDTAESADDDYDEVAPDSTDEEELVSANMKYTINKTDEYRVSPTVSPSTSERSSGSSGNGSRRTPPYISRLVKNKQRSQIATVHNKSDPVLVNVKIYPAEQAMLPEFRKTDHQLYNGHHGFECCINQLHSDRPRQQVTESATQTSPAESRSSSFTWISDCSEDEHSSTTSSTEDSRRLGDSSGDSTPVKDEPESGIGTASPPRHCRYNKPSGVQKYRRKEVWEKLRKRQADKTNNASTNGSQFSPSKSHSRRNSCRNPSVSVESSSDPDLTGFRAERPTCLAFASSLSPESSRETLPSPSATSLKLHMETELTRELSGKSSSAPLLAKHAGSPSRAAGNIEKKVKQSRFHSEKLLVEIEAAEACKWLRAAGFPQYAQMYEDMQFPIDVNSVQKDHQFLEPDALQSLFRRLQNLNKCANMKVEFMPTNKEDESDSDTECALSENWLFQPESRRWSRICDVHHITLPSTTDENSDNVTVVLRNSSLPPFAMQQPEGDITVSRFRRSGSERLRDGAKAFLRRVESLKSKRRKQKNREGVIISGPQIVDVSSMEARIKDLNCVDVTPPESPLNLDDTHRPVGRYLSKPESDFSAFSDSEITVRQSFHDNGNNNSKMLLDVSDVSSKQSQCSSRSGSQDSQSFAQISPIRKKNESTDAFLITEGDTALRQKATVARWHSFQRNSVRPSSLRGQSINSLTVGQILVLRKLSLLKLTAIMERYCPTHRTTGWNWELPKFIRKAKTPDYKDKSVFGVPLLANVQQNGKVLPEFIKEALDWLQMNALDQVGIFRKSGGRSRIYKLKTMAENRSTKINFDSQQPHDVADMVKQYFRELPDALLTNKLSETFVAIFQYVPENLRTEAVQCALILLPDEHREALLILLDFLYQVAQHSYVNQMSASNLAICLAPSLFYWTHTSNNSHIRRSSSMSPKRLQKGNAFPDVKELGQNIAAHECLYFLIKNHQNLFMLTEEIMGQCHFSYMDESVTVSLEELGEELQQDWRGYLNMCRNALSKEIKEKNRGWVISANWEDVEIAYKKVRDGHPLRLWRVCTEVEAPPKELLYRVLRERHIWDGNLLRSRIVQKLEPYAELFQYVTTNIDPLPPKDFCVIRSWKTDLSKGGCMVVETSVEHSDAEIIPGGVRGIVLASRYLIEPCGSGKSRILHLSRVDIKGRGSEWYNKCYGHICAQYLLKIRNSFQRMTEGPESKV